MPKIDFHARFENGVEFSDVYIDGEKRFVCKKRQCLNPYWTIKSLCGKSLGDAETLLLVSEAAENGELEKRLASYSKQVYNRISINEGVKDMAIKIGTGRGKKGDGMTINRATKVKTRGNIRNIHGFSCKQLEALLANPNSRNKDVAKIKRAIARRAK